MELSNALGPVLERALGVKIPKDQGGTDWGSLLLTDEQFQYAANDTAHLHTLRSKLYAELEHFNLLETFELEMRLLPVVVEMQARGMPVDRKRLAAVHTQALEFRKKQAVELKKHLGSWINFDSPEQLKDAFAAISVELPNTNEETLAVCQHEAAKLLLAYRSHEMVRRQAEALLSVVSAERIHAEFKPLGTETGRFSSANPNLQNIGRGELRKAFAPTDPDKVLVVADYSQIELRVAAWFSGDRAMQQAFAEGRDLHIETAAILLGKKLDEVTKQDRQIAKAANFGLVYGQGAAGLVRYAKTNYGVELTEAEAASIRKKFFAHYKGLASWHKGAFEKAPGVAEGRTIIGRRRLLPNTADKWDRFQAQVNFVVQGSCADGLKHALVDLVSRLPFSAHVVGTVHDEVIVECPSAVAADALTIAIDTMKAAFETLFKGLVVEVDGKVCCNWGEK
jgi:DNA polymerase-1